MPPTKGHRRRHTTRSHRHTAGGRHRKHYKDRIYFDMLTSSAFLPSARCSPLERSTYRARTSKTPRYKARHCVRKVRLGRDNRTLYVSVIRPRKIAYSARTRPGYSWKVVYDRHTNKKFTIDNLPPWVVTQIS